MMDVSTPTATAHPGIASLEAVDQLMIALLESMPPTPSRDAAHYHLNTGGQRMRAKLALASASISFNEQDAIAAAAACELLHNASLIHDDISDRDNYRRGQQTVRALFGDDIALCTGDLLMALSFKAAASIKDTTNVSGLIAAMSDCAARVIGGQSIELRCAQKPSTQSFQAYLTATRAKTAPFIEFAIGIGLNAEQQSTANRLGSSIGLAYQIIDDLDDLPGINTHSAGPLYLHPLHATLHHRNSRQCLKHAQAALKRAAGEVQNLPTPLRGVIQELLSRLQHKADSHTADILPPTSEA